MKKNSRVERRIFMMSGCGKVRRGIPLTIALLLASLAWVDHGRGAPAPSWVRSHSGGGVTVQVTYLNPESVEDARFGVLLDTHSVNLDQYNLKNLSLLHAEKTDMLQPIRVESKGSGHHREFTLVFPKPSAKLKRLELVIKNIAGVDKRSFEWDLP
jgi:hypothetical protein